MTKHYLLNPGPTPIQPEIAIKEALPIIHHRTNKFAIIYRNVCGRLKGCVFD